MNQINHPIQPAAFLADAIMPLLRASRRFAIQSEPTAWGLRQPAGKEPQ